MKETILITGTSRGLGAGLGRAFLKKGCHVLGCSRGTSPLASEYPETYRHAALDVGSEDPARQDLRKLVESVPRIDRVILNAGVLPPIRDLRETPLASLRETMEINLWSNKWILDELLALPHPPRQVVAISSGAAVSGSRGWNGYSISKAALNMLIKLYAAEAPDVHFLSLAPGLIHTDMQDYIGSIEADEDYPTIQRLKAARGTPDMPDGDAVGERIAGLMDHFLSFESGSFQDLRKIPDQG